MPPSSIFEGTDEIVSQAFDLRPGDSLKHKSVCRRFNHLPEDYQGFDNLVSELYARMENNWSGRIPSTENWRLTRQTYIGERNTSPEVVLERAIAVLAERGSLEGWFNQVPVASGLIDEHADKRAAIDLVHMNGNKADLVELKWGSDTPAYAAFEILRYGLAYLFCYVNREKFGYAKSRLMSAEMISLSVLAPRPYFETFDLESFGNQLSDRVRDFVAETTDNRLSMALRFVSFPCGFSMPVQNGADVLKLEQPPGHADAGRLIQFALNEVAPVWCHTAEASR